MENSEESKQVETDNTNVATEESKGKYYTEEEIALIEQKAGDKRVSQYQKTLEKKSREADRLSKMSETEKYEYQLQERERLLEEREQELILAQNKTAVAQILAEKNLSLSLVDFCVDVDADKMQDKIKTLEKAFKESVRKEVESRLASTTPKKNLPLDNEITKASISKMSVQELQQLKNTNPELFNGLC